MFEQATRQKFRFQSSVGLLTIEDLWDLPLTSKKGPNLDDIAKGINKELKEKQEESFVSTSKSDDELQVKLDILKHVIRVKMIENNDRLQEAERAERKRKIIETIAKKEDQSLENMSMDELKSLLATA